MNAAKMGFKAVQPTLERALRAVDHAVSGYVQPRRARGKLILQPYVGWGTPQFVELTGRVLLPRALAPAKKGDPRWRNFRSTLRRLLSREVGGVKVTGTLGSVTASGVSDSDGYFTLTFVPGEGGTPFAGGWHEAGLTIGGREGVTRARVQVVAGARFGIISDLDDTVLQSDVTSLPRMLYTSLTGNARTRLPFPGVGALYRAMVRDGELRNPIFYVSSSPWNFFDLLWQFLDYRRIPLGPLFLRNWGFDLLGGHGGYKHGVIERIFTRFPDLKFVLVGDSGEKDPEIYAEVVRRHPGRVLAVYIRDVTEAGRDEGVLKLREEVRRAGVDLVLAADSLNAASHAMAMGLITPGELRSVLTSVARAYAT
ncbi:predicted phosphatase of HAD fold [Deinococcus aerius]|uniref:Predicted phosphatase of HAD fold n=1 Tax=Deinococcus aerius TaxID=200253 RepID=A0A2I9CTQ5_9DEIO|nr:App1 family protein [Deinococcus aerius]GBF05179.1 predicted phosphatase of HAD fold [Deinococcus aerius]